MTRPITHNNALRLSLSPITRATRSLTPPSLAAATRRLVVPNALLDTVPKGTRRQGGSGRRSARMAMLLRSCGGSGRVQEAGRMGGGTRTCAKHGRTRSLRRFEFKTFPADRPVCNTSGSGDACGHPHRQGQPRGRRGDAESRGRGSLLRPVVGVASSTAAASNPLRAWPCRAPALGPRRQLEIWLGPQRIRCPSPCICHPEKSRFANLISSRPRA